MTWDSTKVANGAHTLTATARDAFGKSHHRDGHGHRPTPTPVAPTVSLNAPAANADASGQPALGGRRRRTTGGGVTQVQLKVDGTASGEPVLARRRWPRAPSRPPGRRPNFLNGKHTLRAVARDVAGNETVSDPVTVTVDNPAATPPDSLPPQTPGPADRLGRRRRWHDRGRRARRQPDHGGEPRPGADRREAVARELPQGQVDDDQLPPQRGGQGGALVRAQSCADGGCAAAASSRPRARGPTARATRWRSVRGKLPGAAARCSAGAFRGRALALGRYRITLRGDRRHGQALGPPPGRASRCWTAPRGRRRGRCSRPRSAGSSLAGTDTLPYSWYVESEVLARERERLFGRRLAVRRTHRVSSPSRAPTSRCELATCRWSSCATARARCARS